LRLWICACGFAPVDLRLWICACGIAPVELRLWNCACGIAPVELRQDISVLRRPATNLKQGT
jgi:hypothetical protein